MPHAPGVPYVLVPIVEVAEQQLVSWYSVPFTSLELEVQLIVLLVSIAVHVLERVLLGSDP